jgi:hypothetical protein
LGHALKSQDPAGRQNPHLPDNHDDQQKLVHRGRWLLQSAIAEVARQAKSRALDAVGRSPEIRHKSASVLAADLQAMGAKRAAAAELDIASGGWKQLSVVRRVRCPLAAQAATEDLLGVS